MPLLLNVLPAPFSLEQSPHPLTSVCYQSYLVRVWPHLVCLTSVTRLGPLYKCITPVRWISSMSAAIRSKLLSKELLSPPCSQHSKPTSGFQFLTLIIPAPSTLPLQFSGAFLPPELDSRTTVTLLC